MIEFVAATRQTREAFWDASALGISLKRIEADPRFAPRVAFENPLGLPEVYNARIEARDSEHDILVFLHDDIWLDNFSICDQLVEALDEFDVVGVAGNRRRVPRAPGWCFIGLEDKEPIRDGPPHLSGGVALGPDACGRLQRFGDSPASCELLDGLFIAARRSVLIEHDVRFDPRFRFHFHDMDFCRAARKGGLALGTWPIALTHQGEGRGCDSPDFFPAYLQYLDKWKE
jgi:GT2 family glycosyltransferase